MTRLLQGRSKLFDFRDDKNLRFSNHQAAVSDPGMGFSVTVFVGIHSQRSKGEAFRRSVGRIPMLSGYDGGKAALAQSYLRLI
ncbi:hypothetical protein K0C01_11775 [Salinarchaeum sp. IM2453]|uniref:hypothetical protein n=1 Tax=Salinarchaeum sp. IM2453 TaxID=2862870 RepID=UPI001C835039|nr:hypothetical protein [Salinarchaeum sp. IM2453]QZA88445.1 hypothetical protein K0C01_11775 [Salinarchaeum sp. IM2453]